jgi:hypothetical protein
MLKITAIVMTMILTRLTINPSLVVVAMTGGERVGQHAF